MTVIKAPELTIKTLTKTEFSSAVEKKRAKMRCTYLTAVHGVCEDKLVDFESVRKFLNKTILEKLTAEATDANMLKRKYCSQTEKVM